VLHVSPQAAPEDALAAGFYYSGRDKDNGPVWVPPQDTAWFAKRMYGPGLASAVRALNRLGYIVERIPA